MDTTPTVQDERLACRAVKAYDSLGRRGIAAGTCSGLALVVAVRSHRPGIAAGQSVDGPAMNALAATGAFPQVRALPCDHFWDSV